MHVETLLKDFKSSSTGYCCTDQQEDPRIEIISLKFHAIEVNFPFSFSPYIIDASGIIVNFKDFAECAYLFCNWFEIRDFLI